MKQAIPLIIAWLVCIAAGLALMFLLRHLRKKRGKRIRKPLMILQATVLILALCVGSTAVYLNIHYEEDETAKRVFSERSDTMKITEISNGWLFDGPGNDTALVFYQGAKVNAEAYAPLMRDIAEGGIDCFLLKAPFRMPIFKNDIADSVISEYDYRHWIMAGHSMGGVAAAGYTADNSDKINGLVLLAAYPSEKIDDSVFLLSAYGTNDGVLDKDAYESAKKYFPENSEELIIKGGNHAGFGNYGAQRGDNNADISCDEQQKQTAEAILRLAKRIN